MRRASIERVRMSGVAVAAAALAMAGALSGGCAQRAASDDNALTATLPPAAIAAANAEAALDRLALDLAAAGYAVTDRSSLSLGAEKPFTVWLGAYEVRSRTAVDERGTRVASVERRFVPTGESAEVMLLGEVVLIAGPDGSAESASVLLDAAEPGLLRLPIADGGEAGGAEEAGDVAVESDAGGGSPTPARMFQQLVRASLAGAPAATAAGPTGAEED